jgi:hypothetical protein
LKNTGIPDAAGPAPAKLTTLRNLDLAQAAGGAPDRDLLWQLVTAVGNDPMAPALLVAELQQQLEPKTLHVYELKEEQKKPRREAEHERRSFRTGVFGRLLGHSPASRLWIRTKRAGQLMSNVCSLPA